MDENVEQSATVELLVKLREQTRRSGMLYPEQAQQLKYWPMIIDTAIIGCETRFNYEKSEVEYNMKVKKGKLPKTIEEKWVKLDEWTKFLFGDEYLVRIKLNDKTEFRGKRLKEPPQKSVKEDQDYLDDINEDFEEDKYKMGRYKVK